MRYATKAGELANVATDCLVVPRPSAGAAAEALGCAEAARLALASTPDKTGTVAKVFRAERPKQLLIVGSGKAPTAAEGRAASQDEGTAEAAFRKDMAAAAAAIAGAGVADATLWLDEFRAGDRDIAWRTRSALAAVSAASYRFDTYRAKPKPAKLRRVGVLAADRAAVRGAVRLAQALDEGFALAKDLGNQPPNVCTPAYVAKAAQALAGEQVAVSVVEEAQMAELGMGAFLAVTEGSQNPAKMVVVEYRGAEGPPTVLIGKGITFDTGGINLKPSAGMGEMKFDMCGAASVLGAAKAAIAAKLPLHLVAIAAAAENMPSGAAARPSDIVTTLSGQTVEILNTDAEGRLVLCDALTYAKRYEPAAVVDVATLTGAQVVALGSAASALYANDDELANALLAAGEASHDRLWRMPLWNEYQKQLKSAFADMKNIGGRAAGSITAACFLSRFAKDFPWAHLDIAGTAYAKERSTGRPVGALFEYLRGVAAA